MMVNVLILNYVRENRYKKVKFNIGTMLTNEVTVLGFLYRTRASRGSGHTKRLLHERGRIQELSGAFRCDYRSWLIFEECIRILFEG